MIGRTPIYKQSHLRGFGSTQARYSSNSLSQTMGSLPGFGGGKHGVNHLSASYAASQGIRSPLELTQVDGGLQRFNTSNVFGNTVNIPDFDALEAKRIQKMTQKLQEQDEMFEKLHSSKIFLRSDPEPIDIKHTAQHRLLNTKNNY
jgi:hypothetical protein